MNETTTPLEIPEAAFRAMMETGDEPMRDYVRTIAAPVVAAELRRMADEMEVGFQPHRIGRAVESSSGLRRKGVELAIAHLRARADQIDPEDAGD